MATKKRRYKRIKSRTTSKLKLYRFCLHLVLAGLTRIFKRIDGGLIILGKFLYELFIGFKNIFVKKGIYPVYIYLYQKLEKVKKIFSFRLSLRILSVVMLLALVCTQVLNVSAFEAHVINVKAEIVNDIPGIDPPGGQFCLYDEVEVTLSVDLAGAEIAYTTDGEEPDCEDPSQIYDNNPFMIATGGILQARSCHDGQQSTIASWVFDFDIEYCDDCTIEEGDFCSQTQGGWGTACSGSNPGCLRDNNWDDVIGGNLIVGIGYDLTFNNSINVENFLPQGGSPASLTISHLNPLSTEAGVLGGQVTALKLNVLFSDAGVGLVPPAESMPLGELIINNGKFVGMTVYEFLSLAEEVLGGDTSNLPTGADISDVNDTASSINENFVDCEENNGFLTLPYPYCWEEPEDNLIINKVYYDVDGEHGEEGDNEWVEIYNPNNTPVDISGWNIEDNTWNDVIPASDPIPAHGFAVITGQATTWDYWQIPDEVVKIVLNENIGNGLGNSGDRVILMTPDTSIVDMMSYGGDTFAFDPSCPAVAQGHMLARVPTGHDTDTAADWQDLGPPEVELTYPVGGEIWWVGHHYDITWIAANPNGEDSELSIDLYYSADSGSTWAQIADDTDNDGVYDWRVPLHINGYYVPSDQARIKVIATGPENFMAQDQDESEDFCPPIDYDLLTEEELAYLAGLESGSGQDTTGSSLDEAGETSDATTDNQTQNTGGSSSEEPAEDGADNTASTTDEILPNEEEDQASTTDETANDNTDETSASTTDDNVIKTEEEETQASTTDKTEEDEQNNIENNNDLDNNTDEETDESEDVSASEPIDESADEPEPADDQESADEDEPANEPADEPEPEPDNNESTSE